jgi:photosystem II stability/assembly factor-like uncharacterized protein
MLPFAVAARTVETYGQEVHLGSLGGPYRFEYYCSPNENEVWTVGGQGEVILLTTDPEPQRFRLESRGSFKGGLYGVYFNNEGVGWVVGDSGVIFHSPDRGKTWKEQSVGGEDDLNAITCADNNTCWAVGENGLLLRTTDGGKVWTRKVLAPKFVDLNAVEFVNSKLGWIVGNNSLVLRTKDGGVTWDNYKLPFACEPECAKWGEPLFSVRFVSDKVGWVASREQIGRTTDGGATWTVTNIDEENLTISIIGLISGDGKRIWAVNERDYHYISEDAGRTWKKWTAETDSQTRSIQPKHATK